VCKDAMGPIHQMIQDPKIPLVGLVISLFEGSMYIFVFNWSPAVSAGSSTIPPFGLIFTTFMVARMGGSSLFAIVIKDISAARLLTRVLVVGSIALALPLVSSSPMATLVAFILFEVCVGVYWPAMGTLRSQVVPEENRATIYTIFRVPLNAIVLGIFLNNMSTMTAFLCCVAMLFIAVISQHALIARIVPSGITSTTTDENRGAANDSLLAESDTDY